MTSNGPFDQIRIPAGQVVQFTGQLGDLLIVALLFTEGVQAGVTIRVQQAQAGTLPHIDPNAIANTPAELKKALGAKELFALTRVSV